MDRTEAKALASQMVCCLRTRLLVANVDEDGEQIIFSGGRWGAHALWLSVSSRERVIAHWQGYVDANRREER